jgi:hypothetical protein
MFVINRVLIPQVSGDETSVFWFLFESQNPRKAIVLTDNEVQIMLETIEMIRKSETAKEKQ